MSRRANVTAAEDLLGPGAVDRSRTEGEVRHCRHFHLGCLSRPDRLARA